MMKPGLTVARASPRSDMLQALASAPKNARLLSNYYCTLGKPEATGALPGDAGADGGLFKQVG